MAVLPEYRGQFYNQLGEQIIVTFKHEADTNDTTTDLPVVAASLYSSSFENSGKFDCIISTEAKISLLIAHDNEDVDYTTFLTDAYNEWLVTITSDGQTIFKGYLIPEEGRATFKAAPYTIELRATDGLGLLKDVPLTKSDGTEYAEDVTDYYTLIHFLSTALRKTNLSLSIKTVCSIYHLSHVNRSMDIERDMFDQTYLNYRTFQKTATEYVSCYDVLLILLENNFRIYQSEGMWKINRIEEYGFTEVGEHFYTTYAYDGESIIDGTQTFNEPCNVVEKGMPQLLFPAYITTEFPIKEAKTKFEYHPWPEIPRNNKFERGDFVDEGDAVDEIDDDDDGNFTEIIGTQKRYTIDDWEWGTVDLNPDPDFPLDDSTTEQPLTKKIFNTFGVEIRREISLPYSNIADGGRYAGALKSEGIPVIQGDKISFSIEQRYDSDIDNLTSIVAVVYLITPSGAGYYLSSIVDQELLQGTWLSSLSTIDGPYGYIETYYDESSDARKWVSVSVDSEPIPANGDLYIMLLNKRTDSKTIFYRNLSLEYYPKIGGSFQALEGDYWITSQDKEIKNKREDVVRISDSVKPVIQGTLSHSNAAVMTAYWYRYNSGGGGTARTYKELQNLCLYTENYIRYFKIEGTLKGLKCTPANFPSSIFPIGFEHTFQFPNTPMAGKKFILVPPLSLDLVKGHSQVTFMEVNTVAPNDGDTHEFKYLF